MENNVYKNAPLDYTDKPLGNQKTGPNKAFLTDGVKRSRLSPLLSKKGPDGTPLPPFLKKRTGGMMILLYICD